MTSRLRGAALAALLAAAGTPAPALDAPQITLPQGTLYGIAGDGVSRFMGVRYAAPPARWMPPQPVAPHDGPVDATSPGAACAQGPSPWGTPSTAEDCLFLNLTVPSAANDMGFWQNKPVMVWFHGGGFSGGSGDAYNADALARENDVIVVTVNYRLGALGVLAHPALDAEDHPSANYGLMDMQQSLRWVRDNIAAFGGNPTNVTVFGESAGGIAIYTHLVSPLAQGLFHRAIIESGAPSDISLEAAEALGIGIAAKVGCPADASPQAAACLRAAPVAALLAAQVNPIATIVDGTLLPAPVIGLLEQGRFHHMPLMNGTNRDEGTLIAGFIWDLSGSPLQAEDFGTAVAIVGGFIPRVGYPPDGYGAVAALYDPAKYTAPGLAAAQIITDGTIACPAWEANRILAGFGVPVFQYELADAQAPSVVAPPISFPYGAGHFSELQYLFDISAITLPETPPLTPAQQALARQMRGYWAAFARHGNPNGRRLPHWPAFSATAGGPVQSLNTPQSRPVSDFAAFHQCASWRGLVRQ